MLSEFLTSRRVLGDLYCKVWTQVMQSPKICLHLAVYSSGIAQDFEEYDPSFILAIWFSIFHGNVIYKSSFGKKNFPGRNSGTLTVPTNQTGAKKFTHCVGHNIYTY